MEMANDRFFPNEMPLFVAEKTTEEEEDEAPAGDSLSKLLSMPYSLLSERLKRAAIDLKETIVVETWGLTGQRVGDFTLYCGTLGTAFLLFRSYQITGNSNDLSLCSQIVNACDFVSHTSRYHEELVVSPFLIFSLKLSLFETLSKVEIFGDGTKCRSCVWGGICFLISRDVTFICGKAGVCALGAVVAKHAGDTESLNHYLNQFKMIKLSRNLPSELLYGRVGYLWACLFLNKHLGENTIPSSSMREVASEVIKNGRTLGGRGTSPLMFEWFGEKYWGAAHGLAGIMHVLMDLDLKADELDDVKGTLRYIIQNRFQSGNYPASEEDRSRDVLVHWCHGAPGIALTLVKAAKVFRDEEFLQAAVDAAEVVWKRGLLKRVGICHGISGNAYVFLSLYQVTGNPEYLYRAKAFACFLLDKGYELMAKGLMHRGDRPYSLFEGIGGMAYLFLDMVEPSGARFPAYEL